MEMNLGLFFFQKMDFFRERLNKYMNKYISHIEAVFVEYIPEEKELGKLYISEKYNTASHLCCCGCGLLVVTPLKPYEWQLIKKNGKVSLFPSIGCWSFPCRSHYWIESNKVKPSYVMSDKQIEKMRNREEVEFLEAIERKSQKLSVWRRIWNWLFPR